MPVRSKDGVKDKVVQDLEFYKTTLGSFLHQLYLLKFMSSKLCFKLHLYHELFSAKTFMMALSQVEIKLHCCFKDLGCPGLSSVSKLKLNFQQHN